MTKEEAIKILKRLREPEPWEPQITVDAFEALKLAIEALNKQCASSELVDQCGDSAEMVDLKKRTITERLIIAKSLIDSVIADSERVSLPTAETVTNCHDLTGDLISRQKAIDAFHVYFRDGFEEDKWWNSTHVLAAIEGLPSEQSKLKWETCFDCPLSHGCPKIKGCTNEQAIEYASQIPNDCPLSAQPEVKPIDYRDCADAMMMMWMWMWNVLTDGEYYRIMDKLNRYESERRNDG